jgi:hypothetical protein
MVKIAFAAKYPLLNDTERSHIVQRKWKQLEVSESLLFLGLSVDR